MFSQMTTQNACYGDFLSGSSTHAFDVFSSVVEIGRPPMGYYIRRLTTGGLTAVF